MQRSAAAEDLLGSLRPFFQVSVAHFKICPSLVTTCVSIVQVAQLEALTLAQLHVCVLRSFIKFNKCSYKIK